MTKSEQIRSLARDGFTISEIAQRLGIAYQHAYSVCRAAKSGYGHFSASRQAKQELTTERLAQAGFVRSGSWTLGEGRLSCPEDLPNSCGVYAFVKDGKAIYVGLASGSLNKRIRFYAKPGLSQSTNIRLNAKIRDVIGQGGMVEVFFACPPAFEWNGLAVLGPEGLEAGLIRDYDLPWNVRGT